MKARDLEISPCNIKEIRPFVDKHHYSHSTNGVKIKHCFKVAYQRKLVGGVIFGAMSTTAWKKFSDTERSVIELRRLVLLDEAERNSESRVIGYCLRYIKKNDSEIKIVVSYADPYHGHTGVIYKASNFKYIGASGKDKGFVDIETGKTYHSRALRTKYKGDYKPFVKRLRDRLCNGLLKPIDIPPKHCFVFKIR